MGKSINEFLGINAFREKEDGTVMSHEEQYSNVVNHIGLDKCIGYIPATKEEIQQALKTDVHLNNIPLKNWDKMHDTFKRELIKKGITTISLADTVCTLKQAAYMWAAQV